MASREIPHFVDFLVVTALREEAGPFRRLLDEILAEEGPYLHGQIHAEGGYTYDAVVALVGKMNNARSASFTKEALGRCNPRFALLCGIAGGFTTSGVNEGDVLVPETIVDYETAKLTPDKLSPGDGTIHRGEELSVPQPLRRLLQPFVDGAVHWGDRILETRPDGTTAVPRIHCAGILGSGEKLVADESAEVRRWLIDEYGHRALGVEMEAYGFAVAATEKGVPFLVAKAVQDPATTAKDDPTQKDVWRSYAIDASAAFASALLRSPELAAGNPLARYMSRVRRAKVAFTRNAPTVKFRYRIKFIDSPTQLRDDLADPDRPIFDLIPDDPSPAVALHGFGGTGKSRILQVLFSRIHDLGRKPILLNLRQYSVLHESPTGPSQIPMSAIKPVSTVDDILRVASVPNVCRSELEQLAKQTGDVVVLIDGLNEISRDARLFLLDYFLSLLRSSRVQLLVADRFGPADDLAPFIHARVEPLSHDFVLRTLRDRFSASRYKRLTEPTLRLYRTPFFLSLALRSAAPSRAQTRSAMMYEFVRRQLRIDDDALDQAANATLLAADQFSQTVDVGVLRGLLQGADFIKLLGIFHEHSRVFDHHLWRDYLIARHLANTRDACTPKNFTTATIGTLSLDSLSLALEQLPDKDHADSFVEKVYDWNYFAAAYCLADKPPDAQTAGPSLSMRWTILALLTEKRWDRVRRTRQRADGILHEHRYPEARRFQDLGDLADLIGLLSELPVDTKWFQEWRSLFSFVNAREFPMDRLALIQSERSVTGWTVANVLRRRPVQPDLLSRLCDIYSAHQGEDHGTRRWRVIHALGAYPSIQTVELLVQALLTDPYGWARYGAARSLMEIAADAPELRNAISEALLDYVRNNREAEEWVRRQTWREIAATTLLVNPDPQPGWKQFCINLVKALHDREPQRQERDEIETVLVELEREQELR